MGEEDRRRGVGVFVASAGDECRMLLLPLCTPWVLVERFEQKASASNSSIVTGMLRMRREKRLLRGQLLWR